MPKEILERHKVCRSLRHVHLSVEPGMASAFVELLQNGFLFECQVGANITSFLCEELGLSRSYVAERVSTIFLDGRCVDDIDSATLKEGSVLALSAAMPGLAGASLRRGGVYGAMRSSITHRPNDQRKVGSGLCSVKLFNLLTLELGPVFLQRGILIKREDLRAFVDKKPSHFWSRCHQILLEGKPVERNFLLELCGHDGADLLRLSARTEK